MASPKHLWSGDWESQSTDKAPREPAYVAVPKAAPPPPSEPPRPPWYRRGRPLAGVGAIVAVLVVVGVVLAVTLSSGSKSASQSALGPTQTQTPNSGGQGLVPTQPNQGQSPTTTTPQQATNPVQPSQVNAGPPYNWIGMEINATSSGVTVGSVSQGSVADAAGVDPGDVIASVDATQVDSIAGLQSATRNLKIGARFQLVVDRGSTPVTLTATLTGRPSRAS